MSESFDVRIITASYRREPVDGPEDPQVPVIQVFGRTREGKSIAIEYSGFKPYFFVIAPPQALRGAFARDKQVVAFEDVTLEVEGRPTPCARVVLRQPWKTPEYREKARKFGSTPLRRTSRSSIGSSMIWISGRPSESWGRPRIRRDDTGQTCSLWRNGSSRATRSVPPSGSSALTSKIRSGTATSSASGSHTAKRAKSRPASSPATRRRSSSGS